MDVIILSSPLQNHASSIFTMSSSPSLPSLSEVLKKAPALRTGSRAAPIPSAANATFTSASSLLRTTLSETRNVASTRAFRAPPDLDSPAKSAKSKLAEGGELSAKPKTRKPRAKKVLEGNEVQEKKLAAKRKKATLKNEDEAAVKEKAPRKPRAKKAESQTQPKLSNARVTKSSTGTDGAKEKVAKKALGSFEGSAARITKKALAPVEDSMGEKRPSTVLKTKDSVKALGPDVTPKPLTTKSFSSMMNGFRNGEGSRQQGSVEREVLGTTKRKSPEINKAEALPVKPKPVRKKAKTITDQATAAYVTDVAETIEVLKKPGAITDFFQLKPKAGDSERAVSVGRTSNLSRPKHGNKGLPIILQSPESAIKNINEQEILFGTSSQLAREDSPSFLRDLDQAIKESNAIDDYFFPDSGNDSSSISTSTSQRIMSRTGRSNLWGAASRDQSGKLVDVVDLSKTPVAKVKSLPTHLITDENATEPIRMSTEIPKGTGDTRDVISLDTPDATKIVLPEMESPVKTVQKATIDGPAVAAKSKPVARKPRAKKAVSTEKPDYSSYNTEKLTKTVASFGFKAVKKREQMILLLNKCWEGQHGGIPSGEASTSTIKPLENARTSKAAPASKADTPKKSRGRPKKVIEAGPSLPTAKPTVLSKPESTKVESDSEEKPLKLRMTKKSKRKSDEISDSDSATSRSPSRRRKYQKTKPIVAPKLTDDTDSSESKTQASQAELYLHISKAIKSIPPSTSPDPNWYEKILLYDPIVLEDLTIWLNTGGLERVGWDGEVCPDEVKGWCENKSVCCLWRENLKGGARSRY